MKYVFSLLTVLLSTYLWAQTPDAWQDFLDSRKNGTQSQILDYSYAGYQFSRTPIPDVSTWDYFDVTDFGAVADDEGYDDAGIQAAIDAAEANENPSVVFFPPGKFIVSDDNDVNKFITVQGSNMVLKGSGSGEGGTEIFMDKMRVENGHWQFHLSPNSINTSEITNITEAVEKGSRRVTVQDASALAVDQVVYISHKSEEFARAHFGELYLPPTWSRLFGASGGMNLYEPHIIESIEGNKVTFVNPVQTELPVLSSPFQIRNLSTISNVGVEDILFTSDWQNYGEEFVHHKDDIHDYGWSAVQFEYVRNAWMRNCEFKGWNEVVDVRRSIAVTIENIALSGKKGHASFLTRRSYGLLVKDCQDFADHHHGPGTGYAGVNTVYLRCSMNQNQSVDSHSGQPYATLLDDVQGGDFDQNGGPHESYPHHGRDLLFWNFRHDASDFKYYNFWSTASKNGNTYAEPFFVGFQPNGEVTLVGEGMNQLPNVMVEPRSLFEAQLELRLANESTVPKVTFISPESGARLDKGASLSVEVSASDPDGVVVWVELFINDQLVRRITEAPYVWGESESTDPLLHNLAANNYDLKVIVTDNDENSSQSDINFLVGTNPTVTILRPEITKIFEQGDNVEVEVSASDSDGSIARVELYVDEVLISSKNEEPFLWGTNNSSDSELFNLELGNYTLKAVAYDDDSLYATHQRNFIINKSPTITFSTPENGATLESGANVQINIAASDIDGFVTDVKLYMNTRFLRTDYSSPYTWGFDESTDSLLFNMEAGQYWFRGEASDDRNVKASDSVLVIINAAPLHLKNTSDIMSVFPNPFIDHITLRLPDIEVEHIALYDIKGQKIKTSIHYAEGVVLLIPTQKLSNGLYFIKYIREQEEATIKILKK